MPFRNSGHSRTCISCYISSRVRFPPVEDVRPWYRDKAGYEPNGRARTSARIRVREAAYLVFVFVRSGSMTVPTAEAREENKTMGGKSARRRGSIDTFSPINPSDGSSSRRYYVLYIAIVIADMIKPLLRDAGPCSPHFRASPGFRPLFLRREWSSRKAMRCLAIAIAISVIVRSLEIHSRPVRTLRKISWGNKRLVPTRSFSINPAFVFSIGTSSRGIGASTMLSVTLIELVAHLSLLIGNNSRAILWDHQSN